MNNQLLMHLRDFNYDEDGDTNNDDDYDDASEILFVPSEIKSIDLQSNKQRNEVHPLEEMMIKMKNTYHDVFASDSFVLDDFQKSLWILPMGIILMEYIGSILSFGITIVGFLVLVWTHSDHTKEANETPPSSSLPRRNEAVSTPSPAVSTRLDHVQNCRREVSRLLGTVGAPGLDWVDLNSTGNFKDQPTEISSEATSMVVNFLEAHAHFLTIIDETNHWLRVCTSLHLGLGPRSQCVDRVEKAFIGKNLRLSTGKGQKGRAVQVVDGTFQRVFNRPTVVPLSNLRSMVARQIVSQYDSLLQVWGQIQEGLNICSGTEDSISEPPVVDLGWIRHSRQRLANMLSDSINLYATTDILILLTTHPELRHTMGQSLSNAQNAYEYLQANVFQQGNQSSTRRMEDETNGNPSNDDLHVSLQSYREHVFALLTATWACQHVGDSNEVRTDNDHREWWGHVEQLSTNCRQIETDIRRRFFEETTTEEEANSDESSPDCTEVGIHDVPISTDFQLSDDGIANPIRTVKQDNIPTTSTTKTTVYKGHGSKSDRPAHVVGVVKKKERSNEEIMNRLRARDVIVEREMIQELRNRMTLMGPFIEEDDSDDDGELEKKEMIQRSSSQANKPAAPIFLGASGLLLNELKMSLPISLAVVGGDEDEEEVLGNTEFVGDDETHY